VREWGACDQEFDRGLVREETGPAETPEYRWIRKRSQRPRYCVMMVRVECGPQFRASRWRCSSKIGCEGEGRERRGEQLSEGRHTAWRPSPSYNSPWSLMLPERGGSCLQQGRSVSGGSLRLGARGRVPLTILGLVEAVALGRLDQNTLDPLAAPSADDSGHENAQRSSMLGGEVVPVHLVGEQSWNRLVPVEIEIT
jgi:hypothetical protein